MKAKVFKIEFIDFGDFCNWEVTFDKGVRQEFTMNYEYKEIGLAPDDNMGAVEELAEELHVSSDELAFYINSREFEDKLMAYLPNIKKCVRHKMSVMEDVMKAINLYGQFVYLGNETIGNAPFAFYETGATDTQRAVEVKAYLLDKNGKHRWGCETEMVYTVIVKNAKHADRVIKRAIEAIKEEY